MRVGPGIDRTGSKPRVLVLAGLDPSGGAGLLADVEAIRAGGGRPLACATAITVQTTRALRRFEALPASLVLEQAIALLEEDGPIAAVKLGMLGSPEVAVAVAEKLGRDARLGGVPWVIDPVLKASSGADLGAVTSAYGPLLALGSTILTPNVPEAVALADGLSRVRLDSPEAMEFGGPTRTRAHGACPAIGPVRGEADLRTTIERRIPVDEVALLACARALLARGPRAVIAKGGHLSGEPVDLVVDAAGVTRLAGMRRPGTRRGTGCRFASALATALARGASLDEAARTAKVHVASYLDVG